MTSFIEVDDITPKIQYTATAGQTAFTFPFIAFSDADLVVYKNSTLLTLTTDYTITNLYPAAGGTVTLNSGASAGNVVTLLRDTAIEKTTGWVEGGDFRASTIDKQNAEIFAILQQQERKFNSVPMLPDTVALTSLSLPVPSAGKALLWNATANALINSTDDFNDIVTDATAQAVIATTQAGIATTQAGLAATAKTAAETAETNAETAETNAETAQGLAEDARDLAQGYAAAANVDKIEWQGTWSAGTYAANDAVYKDGTSYIATTSTSETPSVGATDWDVLALKGTDGSGAGDVSSDTTTSVDDELVLFKSTTGKLIKRAIGNGYVKGTSGVASFVATIPPAEGGTGVANGANNTITFTGNYTFGATLTGNTAVTLPISGTLAALGNVNAWTKAQSGTQVALTSTSSHIATDCSLGNNFSHTMTENTTLDNPSNIVAGTYYAWTFTQITAEKTLALGSYFKTADGAAFAGLSVTDGAVNTLYGYAATTTHIDVNFIKNGVA